MNAFSIDGIPVSIIRKKRKSVGIKVDGRGVTVYAPRFVPGVIIRTMVNKHRQLIQQKVQAYQWTQQKYPEKKYDHGEPFRFLGRDIRINLISSARTTRLQYDELLIPEKHCTNQETIKKQVLSWYKKEARRVIEPRVVDVAEKLGKTVAGVAFRNNKTRWGSCSAKGRLNFNIRLMQAPLSVIHYVVVHECCHLAVLNHSPAFWRKVEALLPDYKEMDRWLRENGPELGL